MYSGKKLKKMEENKFFINLLELRKFFSEKLEKENKFYKFIGLEVKKFNF